MIQNGAGIIVSIYQEINPSFLIFLKLSKRIPIYIIYVKQILIFMAERNKERTAQRQKGLRENSGPDWNSYWYPRGC